MKKLYLSLMALLLVVQVGCARLEWTTNLPDSQTAAKAQNKLVLLDFTGSDWCAWCIKMHKEVLDTGKFAAYARNNLVLVEVDFPEKKVLPERLKAANEALQEKYKVEGFPTYIALNAEGKEIWRQEGYLAGGPEAFIAALEKARKR